MPNALKPVLTQALRPFATVFVLGTIALASTACSANAAATTSSTIVDKNWTQPPFGGTAADLRLAFQRSCAQFAKKPASAVLSGDATYGPLFGTYGQWQSICTEALAQPPAKLESFLNTRLARVERTVSSGPEAKFTGYYKPILEGSRTRHGDYQTPLLRLPKDMTRCNGKTGQRQTDGSCTSPYPSRQEITENLENYQAILWLKDPVDAYFLHIQGSGTIELDDGKIAHLGFAGKNGHPYVAIGKTMKQMGYLRGDITADKIRNWLTAASSTSATEVYNTNPSYIFFREFPSESPGAFGVPLVPGRSLAVDKTVLPFGVPVFVESHLTHDNKPWRRIMFAHDVGSAIVGSVRGDIYFGQGPMAGDRAGDQNATGRLFLLVPRENVTSNPSGSMPEVIPPLTSTTTPR